MDTFDSTSAIADEKSEEHNNGHSKSPSQHEPLSGDADGASLLAEKPVDSSPAEKPVDSSPTY